MHLEFFALQISQIHRQGTTSCKTWHGYARQDYEVWLTDYLITSSWRRLYECLVFEIACMLTLDNAVLHTSTVSCCHPEQVITNEVELKGAKLLHCHFL